MVRCSHRLHLFGGGVELLAADVRGGVDHLALEVGEVHHVEIDDADAADARGREVQAERRAQAAGAHQQDFGRFEFLLALDADFRDDQVAAVAQDFVVRERDLFGRRCQGGAAGDGGDQRDGVAILGGGGVLAQVANVLVVEDLLAQVGVVGGERAKHFADGGAGDGDGILASGELAQRGRNQNSGHVSKSTPQCGAGNPARSRLSGGFVAPCASIRSRSRRLKAGCSQDWLPHDSP